MRITLKVCASCEEQRSERERCPRCDAPLTEVVFMPVDEHVEHVNDCLVSAIRSVALARTER